MMFYWGFLHLYSWRYGPVIFCGECFCLVLISGWWWSLFNPLKEFKKDRYKFFFVCLVEFPNEAIWSQTFVCREFLKNYQFYFRSSDQSIPIIFLLDSVMAGCMFLETCPFLPGPFSWHITVRSIHSIFFVLRPYQLFLLFHFLFQYLSPVAFLLGKAW